MGPMGRTGENCKRASKTTPTLLEELRYGACRIEFTSVEWMNEWTQRDEWGLQREKWGSSVRVVALSLCIFALWFLTPFANQQPFLLILRVCVCLCIYAYITRIYEWSSSSSSSSSSPPPSPILLNFLIYHLGFVPLRCWYRLWRSKSVLWVTEFIWGLWGDPTRTLAGQPWWHSLVWERESESDCGLQPWRCLSHSAP